jgi:hypothetical protein
MSTKKKKNTTKHLSVVKDETARIEVWPFAFNFYLSGNRLAPVTDIEVLEDADGQFLSSEAVGGEIPVEEMDESFVEAKVLLGLALKRGELFDVFVGAGSNDKEAWESALDLMTKAWVSEMGSLGMDDYIKTHLASYQEFSNKAIELLNLN